MLNILESDGVRSLHFGSLAVQGAMRIDRPHDIELEYVQQMMMWLLFRNEVAHIVQLGLGAAALTKFYHRRLPPASITAVELDVDVIDACRAHFALPPDDERLNVLNLDAIAWLPEVHDGNIVAIAFKQAPSIDIEPLYARAEQIRTTLGLPVKSWVDGLYAWMNQGMEHG